MKALVLNFLLCSVPLLSVAQTADLILTGGTVYTIDEQNSTAEAVVVDGGRIIYVGDAAGAVAYRGSDTRVIELSGATVLPGLIDAHAHLMNLGNLLVEVNVTGTGSAEEVRQAVLERQRDMQRAPAVQGWTLRAIDDAVFVDPCRSIASRVESSRRHVGREYRYFVRQKRIESAFDGGLGKPALVFERHHLPKGVNAAVGPTGASNAYIRARQRQQGRLQTILHGISAVLRLIARKRGSIVFDRELDERHAMSDELDLHHPGRIAQPGPQFIASCEAAGTVPKPVRQIIE